MLAHYEWKQNSRNMIKVIVFIIIFLVLSYFLVCQTTIYMKSVSEIEKAKENFNTIALVRIKVYESESDRRVPSAIPLEELNIFEENPYVITVDDRVMMSGINLALKNTRDEMMYFKGTIEDYGTSSSSSSMQLRIDEPNLNCGLKVGSTIRVQYQADSLNLAIEKGKTYFLEIKSSDSSRTIVNIWNGTDDILGQYMNYQVRNHMENSAFGLLYTKDMNSIYSVHKGFIQVIEGRTFDESDYVNSDVCLINELVATENSIKVGDVIEFGIHQGGYFYNTSPFGSYSSQDTSWLQSYQIDTNIQSDMVVRINEDDIVEGLPKVSYEVIGIYKNKEDIANQKGNVYNQNYNHPSNIIIPYSGRDSLYSSLGYTEDGYVYEPLLSLKLKTGYEDEFYSYLEEHGFEDDIFEITVDDSNYKSVKLILESMKDNASRYIILLMCAVITIIVLYVYLYIDANYTKFMIMKRLGVTEKKSKFVLYMSMLITSCIGLAIGSIGGYLYTKSMIKESFEQTVVKLYGENFNLDKEVNSLYQFDNSLPFTYPLLICVCVLFVLTVTYLIWFHKIEKAGEK